MIKSKEPYIDQEKGLTRGRIKRDQEIPLLDPDTSTPEPMKGSLDAETEWQVSRGK